MTREDRICDAALKERIYEPKYGGKDHSGYDTLMKYEINDEREEAFCHGAIWADSHPDIETTSQFTANQIKENLDLVSKLKTCHEALESIVERCQQYQKCNTTAEMIARKALDESC